MLTKTEFVKVIEADLSEIKENMMKFREKSRQRNHNSTATTTTTTPTTGGTERLTLADYEDAFNNLYDAKDLIEFYYKQMKLSSDDALLADAKCWVKQYMEELIDNIIGKLLEIRCFKNPNMKSKNGNDVGEGDEIQVRYSSYDCDAEGIPLTNWMEIDRWFWTKDHAREYDDYEYNRHTLTHRSSSYGSYSHCY